VSGFGLLVVMFATWYSPHGASARVRALLAAAGRHAPPPANAWEAFATVDVLLVLLVIAAAVMIKFVSTRRAGALTVAASAVVMAFGAFMTLVVLHKIFAPPGDKGLVDVDAGAYLGLMFTAGITLGAFLALREAGPVGGPRRAEAHAEASPPPEPLRAWGPVGGRAGVGFAVAAIGALYVATRVSFVDRFPYFFDEGTYANFTYRGSRSLHDLFVSYTVGREPLQMWLGIPFVKLGFNPLSAVRIVSVLCGLLTVVVVGLLGRRLAGTAVGLAAAALCVVVPFLVVHDGIGITEPLVTLVMASALYLQIELARRPDLRVAALLGLVLAAGVLTKENTKPALALLPLSLLCFDWAASDRRRQLALWLKGVAIAAVMVVGAELLLRSSSRYDELIKAREGGLLSYTVRSLHDALAQPGVWWDTSWPIFRPALGGYVTIPLLAAAAAGAALGLRRQPRLTAVLLAWIALPFTAAALFTTLPFPRHIMYLLPPAIVLMAYALVEGARFAQRALPAPYAAIATAAATALLLLPALRLDARVLAHPASAKYPSRDDWQYVTGDGGGAVWPAVADAIRRRGTGPQVVILHPTSHIGILRFLLGTHSRYAFVWHSSPLAPRAQLAVFDQSPFGDVLALRLTGRLHFVPVQRFSRPRGGAVVTLFQRPAGLGKGPTFRLAPGSIRSSDGRRLRIVPGGVRGVVDKSQAIGKTAVFHGWAASIRERRPAESVLVFANRRFVDAIGVGEPRPDVERGFTAVLERSGYKPAAARVSAAQLLQSGYSIELPLSRIRPVGTRARLQLFGVRGGVASPLQFDCTRKQQDFGCEPSG
jgi:hypothetical protein